jgi:Zn-dependent protease with chaperone function
MHYKSLNRLHTAVRIGRAWPRVSSYRYPLERWMMLITILIIGLALLSMGVFSFRGLAIFFVIGFAVNYIFIRSIIESFKRDSIEVSDTQFPEIKALVDECRHYVDIPTDTRVFVTYHPAMNAFAMGLGRPYSIVLFSALIDNMDADELKYVIGHEMGHIKFGHTIWFTLIGQFGYLTYGIPILKTLYHFFFLFWSRTAEITADRAGLVGCGRIDKAISAQVKFGAGPWLAKYVDTDTLARQARQSKDNTLAAVVETFGAHPLMTTRIQHLVNFAASETFHILRPDARQPSSSRTTPTSPDVTKLKLLNRPSTAPASKKRAIRRLVPGGMSKIQPATAEDKEQIPSPETPPEHSDRNIDLSEITAKSKEINWSQEVSFNRLNVSALRANAEQAEMWLRLGEILQSNGQLNEAATCLHRAKELLPTSNEANNGSFYGHNFLLAAGENQSAGIATSNSCPTCERLNPQGTHYCGQCQTQLQKPCLECGAWLPARYPNCIYCGQNQSQLIATLKAEARAAQKHAERTLPPQGLTRWENIYSIVFVADIILILGVLAWQSWESSPVAAGGYVGGAVLTFFLGVVISEIVARRRKRTYWRLFDEVELATRRYNDIADTLAHQNLTLDPPRLESKDPWRWASA